MPVAWALGPVVVFETHPGDTIGVAWPECAISLVTVYDRNLHT